MILQHDLLFFTSQMHSTKFSEKSNFGKAGDVAGISISCKMEVQGVKFNHTVVIYNLSTF